MIEIVYKCGFKECKKHYKCQEGFWARVTCQHPDSEGNLVYWYPVQIIRVDGGIT